MTQQYEVVYSTDGSWCAKCRSAPCQCGLPQSPKKKNAPPQAVSQKGGPKMRLEKSGRKGKAVTVVFNLALPEAKLRDLLRDLQKACGTGGTLADGNIEIQGDHRDRIEALLRERDINVKRAGG